MSCNQFKYNYVSWDNTLSMGAICIYMKMVVNLMHFPL
ncbi:hypothetical protein RINTHH_19280 [Richelia intracellularis HH01]|uniref:Uncharacterized protein n=1 Tax=Richelia intracellularis HH01 TaxID=1165094 RepID=M1X1C9_9NOST|nr:hypothetical protein RINTHH_19280 [Richelia intracellularis HH01]